VFNELGSLFKERWEVDSLFIVKARKNTKCVFHIGRNTVIVFSNSRLPDKTDTLPNPSYLGRGKKKGFPVVGLRERSL